MAQHAPYMGRRPFHECQDSPWRQNRLQNPPQRAGQRRRQPLPGDEVLPHNRFERDGDDLKVNVPVDLYTAVLGGKVDVPSLDKTVKLTIPAETNNGKTFRLRAWVCPTCATPTNAATFTPPLKVQLPTHLSEKEKELFQKLRKLREE